LPNAAVARKGGRGRGRDGGRCMIVCEEGKRKKKTIKKKKKEDFEGPVERERERCGEWLMLEGKVISRRW
jgi:hypothetical protein